MQYLRCNSFNFSHRFKFMLKILTHHLSMSSILISKKHLEATKSHTTTATITTGGAYIFFSFSSITLSYLNFSFLLAPTLTMMLPITDVNVDASQRSTTHHDDAHDSLEHLFERRHELGCCERG